MSKQERIFETEGKTVDSKMWSMNRVYLLGLATVLEDIKTVKESEEYCEYMENLPRQTEKSTSGRIVLLAKAESSSHAEAEFMQGRMAGEMLLISLQSFLTKGMSFIEKEEMSDEGIPHKITEQMVGFLDKENITIERGAKSISIKNGDKSINLSLKFGVQEDAEHGTTLSKKQMKDVASALENIRDSLKKIVKKEKQLFLPTAPSWAQTK